MNAVAAVLVFSAVGIIGAMGAVSAPLDAAAVLLLVAIGVANVYIVDRELREVSE